MLPIKSSAILSPPQVVLSLMDSAPLASAVRVTLHTRDQSRAARYPRWGVVQLVGHLTVNEDGEGSNPSAPANFSLPPPPSPVDPTIQGRPAATVIPSPQGNSSLRHCPEAL